MPAHLTLVRTGISLLLSIALIVWLTTRWRMPAFFALLLACFAVGLLLGLPADDLLNVMQQGFGNIMKSLGFIIALGTTLGVVLEHSGATRSLAEGLQRLAGKKATAWAMSLTGFVVGMPIFCDSGFIVLSGLNLSMSARTGLPAVIGSTCLATGLYAVHCLMPPHPGVTAADALLGVDPGLQIWTGMIVAFPTMLAGHAWAVLARRRLTITGSMAPVAHETGVIHRPALWKSVLPVAVPIGLIAAKSLTGLRHPGNTGGPGLLLFLGNPVPALITGILLAALLLKWSDRSVLPGLLQQAVEKAGGILVIIGAGGAFGNVLAETKIGEQLSAVLPLAGMGLLFPFFLTALMKTAQGSSTVAIITSASLVHPLLPALGLAAGNGPLYCVLSMGAGSFVISHANDAYFWVISKFGGIGTDDMLKLYTPASAFMGFTALATVYLLRALMGA